MEAKFERKLASKTARHIREVRTKEAAQEIPQKNGLWPPGYPSECTRNCEAIRKHEIVEAKERRRMAQAIMVHAKKEVIDMMESRSLRYDIVSGGKACVRVGITKDKATSVFEILLRNSDDDATDIELDEAGPHTMVAKMHNLMKADFGSDLERSIASHFLLNFQDVSAYIVQSLSEEAYDELLRKAHIERAKEDRKAERKRGTKGVYKLAYLHR